MAISVKPQNVEVGGEATVMCSITEGYPLYSEINLVCPSGIMKLKNGVPYTFHNLQLKNGGMMRCVLDAVTTQPSKSAILNVYGKGMISHTSSCLRNIVTQYCIIVLCIHGDCSIWVFLHYNNVLASTMFL